MSVLPFTRLAAVVVLAAAALFAAPGLLRRIRTLESQMHHDLTLLPDGRVLYLGAEERLINDTPNGGPAQLRVRGDVLYVLGLDADREEPVWSIFDTHDPLKRPEQWRGHKEDGAEDWTHANSVSLGPRGNVLVSVHRLDQVLSFTPDLKRIEWRLGGDNGDFSFADPADRFYGQHAVSELPGNRLLMFDNGNYRPGGEYSRALELELDLTARTARKVWDYRHEPDIFSDRISNAIRLPNGNTLINFGFRESPDDPTVLVEAGPDGTARWELELSWQGPRISRYRAYPLTSLAGETAVEPTSAGR